MDFRSQIQNQVFGVRATALIVQEGKIYLAKSPTEEYYTVGGAIHFGELTAEAVQGKLRKLS